MQQQNVTIAEEIPEVTAIFNTRVIWPDETQIGAQVRELEANSTTYQLVLREVQTRNLQIRSDATPPTGWSIVDTDVSGSEVRSLTIVQDLGSDEGTDTGLVGVVVQGTNPRTGLPIRTERFEIVQKPSGSGFNLEDLRTTVAVQDGDVLTGDLVAAGIFTRFVSCVRRSCASTCLASLTACAGVFPIYLKCVAVACGGCALKCGACAACNCGFWCRWATGCCRG